MDKGNAGFLNDSDAEWERQCSEAILKEEWIENQKEYYLKNLTVELVDEALDESDATQTMVDAAKNNDFKLLGSCVANRIETHCYVLATIDWDGRMT